MGYPISPDKTVIQSPPEARRRKATVAGGRTKDLKLRDMGQKRLPQPAHLEILRAVLRHRLLRSRGSGGLWMTN